MEGDKGLGKKLVTRRALSLSEDYRPLWPDLQAASFSHAQVQPNPLVAEPCWPAKK